MSDKTHDTKGQNCPIPILKAKKAISEVAIGGTLEVLATDPGAVHRQVRVRTSTRAVTGVVESCTRLAASP